MASGPTAQELLIRARLKNEVSRPVAEINADLDKTVASIDRVDGATKEQTASVMRLGAEYRRSQREQAALGKAQMLAAKQATEAARKQVQSARDFTTRGSVPAAIGLGYLIKKSSDLNETLSLNDVSFGKQAAAMRSWAENGVQSMGMSTRASLEAATGYNEVFRAGEVAEGQAASMSRTLVQIGVDLASQRNTSTQQATEAIQSLLAGEIEPARRYNIFLNEQIIKQKAVALGFKVTSEALDPAVRQQAVYALLLERTGRAQGDFARTQDQNANRMRSFGAQVENTAASLGESLLPVSASVFGALTGVADVVGNLPTPFRTAIVAGAGMVAVAGPVWFVVQRVKLLRLELAEATLNASRLRGELAGVAGASGGIGAAGAGAGAGGVGGMFAGKGGKIAAGAMGLAGLVTMLSGPQGGGGKDIANVLGLGLTGAGMGGMFGPMGMAIGGGVGLGLGGVQALWNHLGGGAKKAGRDVDYAKKALDEFTKSAKKNGSAVRSAAGEYATLAAKVKTTKDELDAGVGARLDAVTAELDKRQALLELRKVLRDPTASEADRTGAMVSTYGRIQTSVLAQQEAGLIGASPKAAYDEIQRQLSTVVATTGSREVAAFFHETFGALNTLTATVVEQLNQAASDTRIRLATGRDAMSSYLPSGAAGGGMGARGAYTGLPRSTTDYGGMGPRGAYTGPARGDTSRPRGHDGAFASTWQLHQVVDSITPGRRSVSNAFFGNPNGDHPAGRALDITGQNLIGYQRNLRRMGGWAEPHGDGGDHHLHAVYGDTAAPRPARGVMAVAGGGGGDVISVAVDARGSTLSAAAIRRSAYLGTKKALDEADERRRRPLGRG